ncbi:MAG TPA: aminotransferase class I/II-fold pyridoxal phosphate-dependent enzyme [Gemmatimonadaceae bacterium]|nr:aminotransferase class I/II-fold pyridoxal phosphate-dependent enzyme [Gemmatimonadaceae bacterium]
MSILKKCDGYTLARETQAAGIYPCFMPIEQSTATEALIGGAWKIMVGSNNYLGLTHHPRILEAARGALTKFGSGSTGSRLLNGTLALHETLERRLAALFHKEDAIVYSTGYQANLGIIGSLVGRDEHVFLDRLNHASIVDAARLSYGQIHRFPHHDAAALDRQLGMVPAHQGKLVVTDGVFSMEGTVAELPAIVAAAKAHDATVLVDEAHAVGVFGANGAGTAEHFGLSDQIDLIMGTFSKSLASIGGVIAGPESVIHWLRHHSRPFVFTASMPPSSVAGVLAALDIMAEEPERRERLWSNTLRVAEGLRSLGFEVGPGESPIIPVVIGELLPTLHVWRTLFDAGVFTHTIAPPAVAANSCRLRVSMTAEHSDEQVERVLEAFARVAKLVVAA